MRNSIVSNFKNYAIHCFSRQRNFDRRTRHHLPHFLNGNLTEVSEMHHGEHTTTAAHCWWQHALLQPFRRRTQQVCRLMSVEAKTGLCHVTRLMQMTARARGHGWSTIVTILNHFRDRPLTQRLKIAQISYRSLSW